MTSPAQPKSPRTWRLDPSERKGRLYFQLGSGSRDNKVTLTLGFVSQAEADRAKARMQEEEVRTFGTPQYGRVFRLRHRLGWEAVARMLLDEAEEFFTQDSPVDYQGMPLRQYVDAVYGPWKKERKPKTWRTESYEWDAYIKPSALGSLSLDEITKHNVHRFLDNLHGRRGKKASPTIQRKCRNAISACLRYAEKQEHRTHPVPQWFDIEGDGSRRRPIEKVLTPTQVLALIDHAPGWDAPSLPRNASWAHAQKKYQSLFACLFALGLRPSEGAMMRWEDINWEASTLFVSGGDEGAGGLKTEASHAVIKILPTALKHLREWWELRGRPTTGLVHPAPGNKVYKTAGSTGFTKSLRAAMKAAGIEECTPYWGRHTYATLSIEAGASVDTVAKTLRHTSPEMVRRHYDHSSAVRAPDLDKAGGIYGDG